jgi:hypothetical protein
MRKVLHLPVLALLAAMAIPATAATPEETAREVLAKSPIIDGHNDTPHQIAELFDRDFFKFDLASLPADVLAKTHTDIKTARAGYMGGQYWSVYVDAALPKHEAVTRTIQQIDVVRQMMARYPETFTYAATAAQVEAAMKKGKIASLIGMEGGHSIGGSLEILRQTYALGARYMTLTHSLTTDWADSATDASSCVSGVIAADAAVGAGFGSAGERCMAISVLVTVGNAADKLLPKIQERIAVLKVGNGLDATSQMGPLINKAHRDRVAGYVDQAEKDGATILVDGRPLKVPGHEGGFFLGPCLLDHVTTSMSCYREEIFGPVLSVVRAATYDDALALIHGHQYGNGTAIFTNDGGAARKFQHDVQIGMVGVNVPIPVPLAYYSFGGWKQSLFGDLHMYGMDGVRFYTRNKVVIARWPEPRFRGVDLGFPQNK